MWQKDRLEDPRAEVAYVRQTIAGKGQLKIIINTKTQFLDADENLSERSYRLRNHIDYSILSLTYFPAILAESHVPWCSQASCVPCRFDIQAHFIGLLKYVDRTI